MPIPEIQIHSQHGQAAVLARVCPGTDDQIVEPFDIGDFGFNALADRIRVFVLNPAAADGQGQIPDFTPEIRSTGPVFFVEQIFADQLRLFRMSQHGHVVVVNKGVQIVLPKAPLRIGDLAQQPFPSVSSDKIHGQIDQGPGISRTGQALPGCRGVENGRISPHPCSPAVRKRAGDHGFAVGEDTRVVFRGFAVNLSGRRFIRRAERLTVVQKEDPAVGRTPHEIRKVIFRIG